MALLVAFAVTLFVAVLISGWAKETVLSTAVLFIIAGIVVGSGTIGDIPRPNQLVLQHFAELALFAVLYTDGMRTGGVQEIGESWRLPGRALVFGMPLTILGIAGLAHWLVGLQWLHAFLVGVALSPTDPVFVSAVFQMEHVPQRIKRLLNLESGLNDGLALPLLLVLLAVLGKQHRDFLKITIELLVGIGIGIAVPWICLRLQRWRYIRVVGAFEQLNAFAIGLLVLALANLAAGNLFLAAFAAGITTASISKEATDAFNDFGELVTELFKLAALLVFGAVIARRLGAMMGWKDYLFIVLAIFVVRFGAIYIAMLRTHLPRREILTAGWFGPKGFASVVYGLMILEAGLRREAHLIGVAVLASIVIYSSTDILIARWYSGRVRKKPPRPTERAA